MILVLLGSSVAGQPIEPPGGPSAGAPGASAPAPTESSEEAEPAPALLTLRCPRGKVHVHGAGQQEWPLVEDGGALRVGDEVETRARGRVALQLVAPGVADEEPTWIFLAPDSILRIQGFRTSEGAVPPGLDLRLRWGRALVCRQGPKKDSAGWATAITTLDGTVRVGVGSAVIRASDLVGLSHVTTLTGTVATTRWEKTFDDLRPVPAGFRRKVGEVGPRAGEAFLWKADPVKFLRDFDLSGACGPTGEECRGPWKPRVKPTGWWGR